MITKSKTNIILRFFLDCDNLIKDEINNYKTEFSINSVSKDGKKKTNLKRLNLPNPQTKSTSQNI
jgi:hypothetical protein